MSVTGPRRAPPGAAARAALAVVLAATAPARAEEPRGLEALLDERVVSTPSKASETASTAPATSTVITAEDLRRYGIRTLDEAINYLSLGMITTNPLHAVEIGARGVLLTVDYGNHVLLLVDGHAMNEQWNGTAYFERGAGVPLELIDHVEVILGPGSVLYGGQAMLGVINIVTKHAKDYRGLHLVGEGELAAPVARSGTLRSPSFASSYMSEVGTGWRAGVGYGEELRLFGAPGEITAQAEYYSQSGPAFHFGPQEYGADSVTGEPKNFGPKATPGVWGGSARDSYTTRMPSGYVRVVSGNTLLALRAATFRRSTPYLDSIINYDGDFDDPENHELDRWLNVELRHRLPLSRVSTLVARAYGDVYDYRWLNTSSAAEDCLDGQLSGCSRDLYGISRQAGLELQSHLDWPGAARASTLIGVDAKVRSIRSKFEFVDRATGDRPESLNPLDTSDGAVGVYLEQSLSPARGLALDAGVRGDIDQRFGSKASPRGALVVEPWRGTTWKAIYSEAFRAPSAYERGYADPSSQIPAPNLGPESERSLEASIEQHVGTQRVLFGAFRSWWHDMVQYAILDDAELARAIARGELLDGTEEAYQYRNLASIDNWGLNAAWEGTTAARRLRYGLNVTSAFTRVDYGDGGDPLPPTVGPQLFGNARAAWDFGERRPTLALAGFLLGRRPADRAFDGGFSPQPFTPPHVELRATLSGELPGIRSVSYRLATGYAFAKSGPYVVGTNHYAPGPGPAELSPVNRLYGFLTLEWNLLP